MTPLEWQCCADPDRMLEFLGVRISARKARLFGCACCRRVWPLIREPACRKAVEVAERFADGLAEVDELKAIHRAAERAKPLSADASWAAAWTAAPSGYRAARECSLQAAQSVARVASENARNSARAAVFTGAPEAVRSAAWARFEEVMELTIQVERQQQADLLRELTGDPFAVESPAGPWSDSVIQLAESLYVGEDCAFALHDALLESGWEEAAAHFAIPGNYHPPGCWVVDAILGKK
jgi:hypothetical protein